MGVKYSEKYIGVQYSEKYIVNDSSWFMTLMWLVSASFVHVSPTFSMSRQNVSWSVRKIVGVTEWMKITDFITDFFTDKTPPTPRRRMWRGASLMFDGNSMSRTIFTEETVSAAISCTSRCLFEIKVISWLRLSKDSIAGTEIWFEVVLFVDERGRLGHSRFQYVFLHNVCMNWEEGVLYLWKVEEHS